MQASHVARATIGAVGAIGAEKFWNGDIHQRDGRTRVHDGQPARNWESMMMMMLCKIQLRL